MIFEQNISIAASPTTVEKCLTDLNLMHRWLNPWLRCEPIGEWQTTVGSRSRFSIQIPGWQPSLESVVIERDSGLIIWQFQGFFQGCDRWQWQPIPTGTFLLNRFDFTIPNPLVSFGFHLGAATLTKRDMAAQLQRLKLLAEGLSE